MMTKRRRREFTPKDKAAILRRHLSGKVPVADLCEEYKLANTGLVSKLHA